MPHISPQKLDAKTLEKMNELFLSSFTSKQIPRKDQLKFLTELLTPTEQMMLAKRLTAIGLLARSISPYQVSKLLKLSETTTNKLQVKMEAGRFKHVIKAYAFASKGTIGRFIENLISPLPPYGKSFLKHLEDTY